MERELRTVSSAQCREFAVADMTEGCPEGGVFLLVAGEASEVFFCWVWDAGYVHVVSKVI